MNAPATWAERIRSGEPRAIARAITAIENGNAAAQALRAALEPCLGAARVVGITGPPGAGKSTLVSALARELIGRGKRVAVLAFDPSSPLTGGAVLGDRIRMADVQASDRMFIRSVASRGHLGGLARSADAMVDVLDAAGFDYVLLETVGTGQSEVEIAALAPTRLLVCPPGAGDDVQMLKAGILEIADAFLVNKADLPGAARTEGELQAMLALGKRQPRPPVLKVVATTGQGVGELVAWLEGRPAAGASARPRRPAEPEDAPALLARLFVRDGYAKHLGLELVEAGRGSAAVRMRVRPEHINFLGSCHGGAIFSLADMALGLACNSYGTVAALIDAHMTFSAAVREGDTLTARAVEISRTRKLAIYRIDVARDGVASVASMTGTVYLAGKALPEAGA